MLHIMIIIVESALTKIACELTEKSAKFINVNMGIIILFTLSRYAK